MITHGDTLDKVLLCIRSVKGSNGRLRKKVYNKVKEWRRNNPYVIKDYHKHKALISSAMYLEMGGCYEICFKQYAVKMGFNYEFRDIELEPGDKIYIGDISDGFCFITDLQSNYCIPVEVLSQVCVPLKKDERSRFLKIKTKVDSLYEQIGDNLELIKSLENTVSDLLKKV